MNNIDKGVIQVLDQLKNSGQLNSYLIDDDERKWTKLIYDIMINKFDMPFGNSTMQQASDIFNNAVRVWKGKNKLGNMMNMESRTMNMNIINEIGDTVRGQEMLGRTAERAHQRAQRTSGADKQRHEKTEWDAYQTAAGNSRKHLDGSGAHFARGRDAEYDEHWDDGRYPWSKKHKSKNESRNMNKKLIRLTEQDLHRIVKASVKRIVKENLYRNKNGKLIWEPAEETKYSIGPEGPNGWPNLLNKDDRSETGYQIYGWEELPDDKRRYSVWNSIARNSEDFIPEQKMHRIVKESVKKIIKESEEDSVHDYWREAEDNYLMREKLPRGWERIEREDDEPIYRDPNFNEYVKNEYGRFVPLNNEF